MYESIVKHKMPGMTSSMKKDKDTHHTMIVLMTIHGLRSEKEGPFTSDDIGIPDEVIKDCLSKDILEEVSKGRYVYMLNDWTLIK